MRVFVQTHTLCTYCALKQSTVQCVAFYRCENYTCQWWRKMMMIDNVIWSSVPSCTPALYSLIFPPIYTCPLTSVFVWLSLLLASLSTPPILLPACVLLPMFWPYACLRPAFLPEPLGFISWLLARSFDHWFSEVPYILRAGFMSVVSTVPSQ